MSFSYSRPYRVAASWGISDATAPFVASGFVAEQDGVLWDLYGCGDSSAAVQISLQDLEELGDQVKIWPKLLGEVVGRAEVWRVLTSDRFAFDLLRAAEEAGLVDLKLIELIVEGESSATVFALVAQCDLDMLRENAARHAYATAKLMRRFGNGETRHAFHRAARAAWLISPEKSAEYKSLYNEARLRMGMVPLPRLGSKEQKSERKENVNLVEYKNEALKTASPGMTFEIVALGIAGETGEVCDLVKKHIGHGHPLDKSKLVKELGDLLWYAVVGIAKEGALPFEELDVRMATLRFEGSSKSQKEFQKQMEDLCLLLGQRSGSVSTSVLYGCSGYRYMESIVEIIVLFARLLDETLSSIADKNIEKLRARYGEKFSTEASLHRKENDR